MKQKLKDKKKKERALKVRKKLDKQYEKLVKERKLQEEEILKEKMAQELGYGKPRPIVRDEKKREEIETQKHNFVSERLKKNLELLEALEAEYDQEHSQREEVNAKLEGEGHLSIKDKMNALHQRALEMEGLTYKLAEAKKNFDEQQIKEAK